jgi:alanine racemase
MFDEARRSVWMEISRGNIKDNYLAIRNLAKDCEIIACIKGDAYGHGIVKTAWALVREGVEYLGVATIDEAISLRSAGIRTNIVLLSPVPRGNTKDVIDLRLIPVITTFEDAKLLSDMVQRTEAKDISYFIAVETGMGRLGFMHTTESFEDIIAISHLPGLTMLGVHSHFSSADESDLSFSLNQLEEYAAFVSHLQEVGIDTGKRSMANSAAIMALPDSHFDIVRPGIALYGIYPSDTIDKSIIGLKPAMTVKAHIVYLKKVPAGTPVSYGHKFITDRESLIATLPVGYEDGLPRNTFGKARILVRGHYAPIVGTICMDLCMADVTDVPGVQEYDEVTLIGEQDGKRISAEEIAENSGTIAYEVLCRFGLRIPRKYV